MTPAPHAPQLFDDVLALLPPLQKMLDDHRSRLDAQRISDSEPTRQQLTDWEEVRRETAIEASDALSTLVTRLEQLVAHPPIRAHTLVVAGSAHDELDDWNLIVVNATSLDDAEQTLATLPTYRQWVSDEQFGTDGNSPEPYVARRLSHPGTRASGTFWDLRDEQARNARGPSAARTIPAPPPTSSAPRCSR